MSEHLNRIRQSAGLPAPLQPVVSAVTVGDLLGAPPARADLDDLRFPALTVATLAMPAAWAQHLALAKLAGPTSEGETLHRWATNILTVGNADVWVPYVAVAAVIMLVIAAVRTETFDSGTLTDTVMTVAGTLAGGLSVLPLVVALAYGVVVLIVMIVLTVLAVIAGVIMVFGFFSAALDS